MSGLGLGSGRAEGGEGRGGIRERAGDEEGDGYCVRTVQENVVFGSCFVV